jgi:hypothetical protein
MQGSANSRGVLPSERHTLVETAPTAGEVIQRNNSKIVIFFIIFAPKNRMLLEPATQKEQM